MEKGKIVIANWKMNPTTQKEAGRLLDSLKEIKKEKEVEIVICPPFPYLNLVKDKFILGAQNCFSENKGAYTGEVSPLMLKDMNCQYVLLGHSERKKHFNETDQSINLKLKAALKARLKPVLCVGEETRDSFDHEGRSVNEMSLIIREQVEKALIDISEERIRDIVFAYEPVWAISTEESDNPCSSDDAMKAALFIRKILTQLYNREVAEKARIIYGGSVKSRNASDYLQEAGMDGVLVGSASLNASEFIKIVEKAGQ